MISFNNNQSCNQQLSHGPPCTRGRFLQTREKGTCWTEGRARPSSRVCHLLGASLPLGHAHLPPGSLFLCLDPRSCLSPFCCLSCFLQPSWALSVCSTPVFSHHRRLSFHPALRTPSFCGIGSLLGLVTWDSIFRGPFEGNWGRAPTLAEATSLSECRVQSMAPSSLPLSPDARAPTGHGYPWDLNPGPEPALTPRGPHLCSQASGNRGGGPRSPPNSVTGPPLIHREDTCVVGSGVK